MAYTIEQIKVAAYNCDEKADFTVTERNLFLGLAYCYEWYRANPDDKKACEDLMSEYLYYFCEAQYNEEQEQKTKKQQKGD